jgi:DNA repair protein RecO (recombination protein O)
MAVHYRTLGFILKKEDRGEFDRVFTVFTKDFGKLQFRAISERKSASKLRGGLELFYISEIEFIEGKNQKTVVDAVVENQHVRLRGSLKRARVMYRLAEIFDEVLQGEEGDERTWDLVRGTASFLDQETLSEKSLKLIFYYFVWNLLSLHGYRPELGTIAQKYPELADMLQTFLAEEPEALHEIQFGGIHEGLLNKISQTYLSRVLDK